MAFEVARVTPARHESLVDLLLELHEHYIVPPVADRAQVREHLRERLLPDGSGLCLAVAFQPDDTVIGLAALALFHSLVEPGPAQRRQCLLKELYVRRPNRGQGVGSALVRWSASHALANGCARMDWHVNAHNHQGIGFYQSLGAARVEDRLSFRLSAVGLRALTDSAAEMRSQRGQR